ncbi:hypothetical protein CAL26_21240 [Bordetella genomosp. 9]|uniref:DUF8033 domain-containing protein n=1 Tax=Bordetella genomosp. 9 TaxID=1416803 RepID=A0A261R611_9BORD|nr:hypothetical protein CAL26_21240 [Bordetella genomosp. 9]
MRLLHPNPKRKDPVVLEYRDGTQLLFSYEVPIAAFIPGQGYIVSDEDMSPTNERRVAEWVDFSNAREVSQDQIFHVITSRRNLTAEEAE